MEIELRELKTNVIHDFPYPKAKRKCPHVALISITHSGCCVHRCPMCYARAYAWSIEDKIVMYKNVPKKLETEIKKAKLLPPFYISQVSDALQPVPEVREITFEVVRILMHYRLSFHILTKSAEGALALIDTIPELIHYPYWYFAMTVEAPPAKKEVTSPYADEINDRFIALKKIGDYGIPIVGRTDPTILGLIEIEEVCELIRRFAEAGVKHIVGSLGYYNSLSMGRLIKSITASRWKDSLPRLEKIYGFKVEHIDQYPSRKRVNASLSTRIKFHSILKREAERYGLTYGICLELPKEYDSPGVSSCDGMIKNFVHLQGRDGNFYPINCSGDCLRSCPDLRNPPCGGYSRIMREGYPYKLKKLCEPNLYF